MTDAAIVAPQVRDLADLALAMAGWLAERVPGARDIRVTNLSYPLGAGLSHETILFDAEWTEGGSPRAQGMVVRIKPSQVTVYQDDMFDEQYRLMQVMHDSGTVRIARPLWFEPDAALLSAPFFVMEKVAGRVAVSYPPYSKQGWLVDATPEQRATMWRDAVSQLAEIHRVPISSAPFLAMPGGATGFDQEIDRWRRYIDWVDPAGERRLLRDTFAELLAKGPANRPEGIVWGDARLGNMMIGPDFSVAAVMDWEQPSLGGALQDLGWWLQIDQNQTVAQGITPLGGMGNREQTIALWSEVSGKSAVDIEWYEAFACFKMECLAIRMIAIREMPAAMKMAEPGSRTKAMLEAL